MTPYRLPLTHPATVTKVRAGRQRQLTLARRREQMAEIREAIAPGGLLVVEGMPWRVEVRETEDGLVRADARCGAFRVDTVARWSNVEQVAREIEADLREHVASVHDQVVDAAEAIRFARAIETADAGDLAMRAG